MIALEQVLIPIVSLLFELAALGVAGFIYEEYEKMSFSELFLLIVLSIFFAGFGFSLATSFYRVFV